MWTFFEPLYIWAECMFTEVGEQIPPRVVCPLERSPQVLSMNVAPGSVQPLKRSYTLMSE